MLLTVPNMSVNILNSFPIKSLRYIPFILYAYYKFFKPRSRTVTLVGTNGISLIILNSDCHPLQYRPSNFEASENSVSHSESMDVKRIQTLISEVQGPVTSEGEALIIQEGVEVWRTLSQAKAYFWPCGKSWDTAPGSIFVRSMPSGDSLGRKSVMESGCVCLVCQLRRVPLKRHHRHFSQGSL